MKNTKHFQRVILLFVFQIISLNVIAQEQKPRLVIGIVVDQMRNDYIERYWDKFSENGFKKLVKQGYRFQDMNYSYVPTYTAPGHASIYSGTTPAVHGIVANDWYDRNSSSEIYCVGDTTVKTVGAVANKQGQMSPRNMISGTIGDELRKFYKDKSKVIGIALKDRGAILPAGHSANAAYWMDGESGNWISSTFYMNTLPEWLERYNSKKQTAKWLENTWNTLLPIERYTESLADDNIYEKSFKGKDKPVFPYYLKKLSAQNGKLNMIKSTPFGNTMTAELAKLIIQEEHLGEDSYPDLLCISFSATDYVGHQFGPDAVETEDTYLRLDLDLAELIKYVEEKIGKNQLLVFLTADHGGANNAVYMQDRKLNAGIFNSAQLEDSVRKWIKEKYFADDWFLKWTNYQIYLDETRIKARGIETEDVELFLCRKLEKLNGVRTAVAASDLRRMLCMEFPARNVQKGFYPKRSGNIYLIFEPAWMEFYRTGTTHGSPYSYDTQIPMLWYGLNLPNGNNTERVWVEDIAPTVAMLLGISPPNGSRGKVLEFLDKKSK